MCIRSKVFAYTEYYSFMKMYEYRIPNTIRSSKYTNTEYRIVFKTLKSTYTEYRIVLFGPNYSRIPNNRIIRCNSAREKAKWSRGEGNVRLRRRKSEVSKIAALLPLNLCCRIFKNKTQRPYIQNKMHHFSSHRVYGSYSL